MKVEVPIVLFDREGGKILQGEIAREFPLTILLNDEQLATLLCSPEDMQSLAVGFLYSEGLLQQKGEIREIHLDEERGIVRIEIESGEALNRDLFMKRVITTGCGRGIAFYNFADLEQRRKIETSLKVSSTEILALMQTFQSSSETYRQTHGVHSAALCDREKILLFKEDIGRHNAIDKIFGQSLLEDIPLSDRIFLTTGRISSEILFKVAKRNIPVLVSRSAPMDLAVNLGRELGMTLIGNVRGGRMYVYSGEERINEAVQ